MELTDTVVGADDVRQHPLWDVERELEGEMEWNGTTRYRRLKAAAIKREEQSAIPAYKDEEHVGLRKALEPTTQRITKYLGRNGRGRKEIALNILGLLKHNVEKISYLTAKIVFDQISRKQSYQSVAIKIGHAIETELRFQHYRAQPENATAARHTFDRLFASQVARKKGRHHIEYAVKAIMVARGATAEPWTSDVLFHVGSRCIDLFRHQGLITIQSPKRKGKKSPLKEIRPTDEGMAWLNARDVEKESMYPVYMPMVIPPKPWTENEGGGYYAHNLRIVRTRFQSHFNYFSDLPEMPEVYKALNAIQSTAWKVNCQVLDVVKAVWLANSEIGGLPSQENHPLPSQPTTKKSKDAPEWKAYRAARTEVEDQNTDLRLQRLVVHNCLVVADRMHEFDAIYFPHQLDFRGRVYPTPVYLHPQDADFSRAMLTFSEGKPLGKDGAYWLAVHGANCWGEDKVSLDARVKWVEANDYNIMLAASDPLDQKWWADADKPWQFLAFCFEWLAYRANPTTFVSHLPVDMDGTCNGLQHFSAMMRDEYGAAAVNLIPYRNPQDIYQRVANRVVDRLIVSSSPFAAAWLAFGIDRKITKRPVMIMPYGGTLHACKDYVGQAVLDKMRKGAANPFPNHRMTMPIHFLAKLVWECIGDEVSKAKEAMAWLQTVAVAMTDKGLPVTWMTPAGFRAMQLYPKMEQFRIETFLHGVEMKDRERADFQLLAPIPESLDDNQQKSGIAPNFVHSMDGSALMVTVNHCAERGVTAFHMVHDSYGTHAADTRVMGEMLRGAFYQMYKDHCPLTELREAVLPDVGEGGVDPVPEKGSLDLAQVLNSKYFFA